MNTLRIGGERKRGIKMQDKFLVTGGDIVAGIWPPTQAVAEEAAKAHATVKRPCRVWQLIGVASIQTPPVVYDVVEKI